MNSSARKTPSDSTSASYAVLLKGDVLASIVVFLVALPLCMGIALASGVPVASGLITGIVGGLLVGWLAGCPLQVSGPAAGLTVIVYDIVQAHGLENLALVVIMAGLLQLVAGVLRLGQWFRAVSPAVIKGMLAGIGCLILFSQFHVMIDDRPQGNGAKNLLTIPQAIIKSAGIPRWTSRELRRSRADSLQQIGELHRRQLHNQQTLTELLAHKTRSQAAAESPTRRPLAEVPAPLVAAQGAIHADLARIAAALAQAEARLGTGERSVTIQAAARNATERVQEALSHIEADTIEGVIGTQREATAALEGLLASLKNHTLAAYIGILTIVVIILWQSLAPRSLRIIPAPLVAVVTATTLAFFVTLPVIYVEVPDNMAEEIRLPTLGLLRDAPWMAVFQAALLMAVVASAETLLCATAVDQMHRGPRTRYDRELMAQGVGNTVCGVLGALPMTGVIVRSSANVLAGGTTRVSAMLHGLWLLIFVAGLAFLLRQIPTATLAAILVFTGYKLINIKSLAELRQYGWGEVVIYVATVVTIVSTDLLTGVLVGVALSAAKLLYTFSHLEARIDIDSDHDVAVLKLKGAATFIRLPLIADVLETVPPGDELHVDFEHLSYIDHACLDLLMNWAKQHEATAGKLVVDWQSLHAKFYTGSGNERALGVRGRGPAPTSLLGRAAVARQPEG